MVEPELITIIEGPTPEFHFSPFAWSHAVYEGPIGMNVALCELRTNNGRDIIARCKEAWQERRPVKLDYPDDIRARQQLDVVAMRLRPQDEGDVLMLWVREPLDEEAVEAIEGNDPFGLFGDLDDDLFDDDSDEDDPFTL